jgi:predicted acyltransferase
MSNDILNTILYIRRSKLNTMPTTEKSQSIRTETKERLISLDTLRGFDMAMLVGIGAIIIALADLTGWKWMEVLATQQHHVKWVGFRFYDMIFPLFMFISGVAIPYAINSKVEKGIAKSRLLRKIFIRLVALILLGMLYNGALSRGFTNLRYVSVLSQIGFGYFFAALISLYSRSIRGSVFWLVGIMAGIAVLQLFVPVPGHGAGTFDPEFSINAWLDRMLIPGRLNDEVFDPEGVLCIISAITITLMGTLAGYILRSSKAAPSKKALYIAAAGVGAIAVALALSTFYPIIKKMWTVPYVLLAGGVSALLLSLFYYVIDVKGSKNWTLFFRVFGMNSITIYMAHRIIDFEDISSFFLNFTSVHINEQWGAVFITTGALVLQWGLLYFLSKRKIFLRV